LINYHDQIRYLLCPSKPKDLKEEAIRLALTSSQPIAKTARDLSLKESTLYNWLSKAKDKAPIIKKSDGSQANLVIKNGTYVPELNGYVAIAGGKGGAKGIFVGLDRATSEITTMHLKPVSYFENKAPSLGRLAKPKSELTDLIRQNREWGWKLPYRRNNS
jgi:hypothetical protein